VHQRLWDSIGRYAYARSYGYAGRPYVQARSSGYAARSYAYAPRNVAARQVAYARVRHR